MKISIKTKTNSRSSCRTLPLGVACAVAGAALAAANVRAQQPASNANAAPAARIAAADNGFGLRLFEAVHKKEGDKNVCVSPLSIALALQMTYNGASGTTRAAMSHALELGGMTLNDVNKANSALLNTLPVTGQRRSAPNGQASNPSGTAKDASAPRLEIANSLWLQNARAVNPDFLQRTRQYYGAQVSSLEGAPDTINTWVNTHTQGKITKIVTAADVRSAFTVLVNAVYFKAAWDTPFYKEATSDKPFHLASGATRTSKMMAQTQYFNYYAGEGLQMVSLPYRGCDLDMIVALPKAGTNLAAFLPTVTPAKWQQWTAKMTGQRGTVELPRFRAEFGVECQDTLAALGMGEAFTRRADFSAMSSIKPLFISKVVHKTYINVDEQGTEAAAATAVVMRAGSALPVGTPFKMTMDRPFLYAIRDRQTGVLLFIGTLADPG